MCVWQNDQCLELRVHAILLLSATNVMLYPGIQSTSVGETKQLSKANKSDNQLVIKSQLGNLDKNPKVVDAYFENTCSNTT